MNAAETPLLISESTWSFINAISGELTNVSCAFDSAFVGSGLLDFAAA